ncbi:MAG: hypothetical protein IKW00_09915 [Clostridia bacterium]|nr:hypothetical protein [Clostridia bacterium]
MPAYRELVQHYKNRRRTDVVDAVTAGLSLADDVAVDLGLLEDTGLAGEIVETAAGVLPFAVIAVTEQCNVLLGKKTAAAGAGDAAYRMIKTGAAMGAGAAAVAAGASAAVALPVAVGARLVLDRYRCRTLTGYRVSQRTQRLKALVKRRAKTQITDGD